MQHAMMSITSYMLFHISYDGGWGGVGDFCLALAPNCNTTQIKKLDCPRYSSESLLLKLCSYESLAYPLIATCIFIDNAFPSRIFLEFLAIISSYESSAKLHWKQEMFHKRSVRFRKLLE